MGAPRKRRALTQGKNDSRAKKKKATETPNPEKSASSSEDGSEQEDENAENEMSMLSKNVAECRVSLEQVLVTLKEFQDRMDILEKRVMEVQLNRSESLGGREAFVPRKGNPCLNEKDSLFKEAFESSVCKLRVTTSFLVVVSHLL